MKSTKRILLLVSLALVFAGMAHAQTGAHSAKLSWAASADSTSANPGTVAIYQASGACPASGLGSLTFATVTTTAAPSATAANPYIVTSLTPGTYCFYLTATIGGATSGPSNTSGGSTSTFPPTSFTVVVQ